MTNDEFDFGFTAVTAEELGLVPASSAPPQPETVVQEVDLTPLINQIAKIEQKIDKVIKMEEDELTAAIENSGSEIESILTRFDEKIQQEKNNSKQKLLQIEGMILPLLNNLMLNPEKEYIKWPNRVEKIQTQIQKILSVTRSV